MGEHQHALKFSLNRKRFIKKPGQLNGFVTGADLLELADRLGLRQTRAEAIVDAALEAWPKCKPLIERSFLSDQAQTIYAEILADRQRAISVRSL